MVALNSEYVQYKVSEYLNNDCLYEVYKLSSILYKSFDDRLGIEHPLLVVSCAKSENAGSIDVVERYSPKLLDSVRHLKLVLTQDSYRNSRSINFVRSMKHLKFLHIHIEDAEVFRFYFTQRYCLSTLPGTLPPQLCSFLLEVTCRCADELDLRDMQQLEALELRGAIQYRVVSMPPVVTTLKISSCGVHQLLGGGSVTALHLTSISNDDSYEGILQIADDSLTTLPDALSNVSHLYLADVGFEDELDAREMKRLEFVSSHNSSFGVVLPVHITRVSFLGGVRCREDFVERSSVVAESGERSEYSILGGDGERCIAFECTSTKQKIKKTPGPQQLMKARHYEPLGYLVYTDLTDNGHA